MCIYTETELKENINYNESQHAQYSWAFIKGENTCACNNKHLKKNKYENMQPIQYVLDSYFV